MTFTRLILMQTNGFNLKKINRLIKNKNKKFIKEKVKKFIERIVYYLRVKKRSRLELEIIVVYINKNQINHKRKLERFQIVIYSY